MAPPAGKPKSGSLTTRIVTAVVVAPVVLGVVYLGYPIFDILIAAMALILAFEWNRLCSGRPV